MKKRFQMMVTEKEDRALKALSKQTGSSVGELVRRAIDEYLAHLAVKKGAK